MRTRWWGASGRRVPELAVEGDPELPLEEALVLDGVDDLASIAEVGTPVAVVKALPGWNVSRAERPQWAPPPAWTPTPTPAPSRNFGNPWERSPDYRSSYPDYRSMREGYDRWRY